VRFPTQTKARDAGPGGADTGSSRQEEIGMRWRGPSSRQPCRQEHRHLQMPLQPSLLPCLLPYPLTIPFTRPDTPRKKCVMHFYGYPGRWSWAVSGWFCGGAPYGLGAQNRAPPIPPRFPSRKRIQSWAITSRSRTKVSSYFASRGKPILSMVFAISQI
jgi:hypothetical protein